MAKKLRCVLVTTEFRGVFCGYAGNTSGDTIRLKDARMCVYWSSDMGGVVGLANKGPSSSCKIGPRADIELRKITAVMEVTPEAEKAWSSATWK